MKAFVMQLLQSIALILISVWVLLSLLLYLFQPKFVYFPISDLIATPEHAGLDFEIVPYSQGRALFREANEPKSFLEILGDHNSGFYLSGKLYRDGLQQFINRWF